MSYYPVNEGEVHMYKQLEKKILADKSREEVELMEKKLLADKARAEVKSMEMMDALSMSSLEGTSMSPL